MRAARRDAVVEANRREQAAFGQLLGERGRERAPSPSSPPAPPPGPDVRLGITAALTDEDLAPATLAAAVEELGFDSLYLPEHTHLPVQEDTPPALVGGVRLDDYKRCLDPLVALSTAAAVTTRIGLGTGILLAAQHEPILLAKQVATLDHLSGGRVTLGVGYGWNRTEAEDHGVDWAPPARRGARAPGRRRRPSGRPTRPSSTGSSWTSGRPGRGPSRCNSRGCARWSAAGPTTRCSLPWWRAPTAGSPSVAAAWPPPSRACTPWPPKPGGTRPTLSVVPFGTIADQGKLEHYAGLGITEVVLRVRAGDEPSVRAELESLAPLIAFAGTLEQP